MIKYSNLILNIQNNPLVIKVIYLDKSREFFDEVE